MGYRELSRYNSSLQEARTVAAPLGSIFDHLSLAGIPYSIEKPCLMIKTLTAE